MHKLSKFIIADIIYIEQYFCVSNYLYPFLQLSHAKVKVPNKIRFQLNTLNEHKNKIFFEVCSLTVFYVLFQVIIYL